MIVAELTIPEIPLADLLLYVFSAAALMLGLNFLFLLVTNRRESRDRHQRWYSVLAYLAFLVTVAILAVTSFGALIQFGHMSGYVLMAHIAAAGAFVFLLFLVALLFLPTGAAISNPGFTSDNRWWLARWSAWVLIFSSLIAAGTMLLSMLPIFDTDELLQVALIHRYAGLTVLVAAVFHAYTLVCTRLGMR